MIIQVFSQALKIKYKARLFSKATFFLLITGVLSIILPLFIAHNTKGFLVNREKFYEQPHVKFRGEFIFVATTNDRPITCSSFPFYREKLSVFDTCTMIKVREYDNNYDNKNDGLELKLNVNLPKESRLNSITLIIPLDYTLITCPLDMKTAVIYQKFLPSSVRKFEIIGDLSIVQSSPLFCRNHIDYYNYPLVSGESQDSYVLEKIIENYSKRNITTKLTNVYTNFLGGDSRQFELNLKLRIPEDVFYYKPGIWQIMKMAWIQFYAIYIIIAYFIRKIKKYVFRKRFVLFYKENPFIKNK